MKKVLPLCQSWRMIDDERFTISVSNDDFEFIKQKLKEEQLPIISQDILQVGSLTVMGEPSILEKYKIAHVIDVEGDHVVLSNEVSDKFRYVIPLFFADKEIIEPMQHVLTFGVFQVLGGIAMYDDLKLH